MTFKRKIEKESTNNGNKLELNRPHILHGSRFFQAKLLNVAQLRCCVMCLNLAAYACSDFISLPCRPKLVFSTTVLRSFRLSLVFPELEAVPLQRFSEHGHDKWCKLGCRRYRDVVNIRPVFQLGRPPDPLLSHLFVEFRHGHPQGQRKCRRCLTRTLHESVSDRDWSAAPRSVRTRCWLRPLFACPQVGNDCAKNRAPSLGTVDCVPSSRSSEPVLSVTSNEHLRRFDSHSLLSSLYSLRLVLSSFVFSLRLVLSSSLPSSLLSVSVFFLSLSLSLSVSVPCGVVVVFLWCVMLCCVVLSFVVRCGVQHAEKTRVSVQNVPVCTIKTSPCIPAGTTRTCVSTCARGAGMHGDVLDGHTGEEGECRRQPRVSHR